MTDEQKKEIGTSMQKQRIHRAFKILSKNEEFAGMNREELRERIHYWASTVADTKASEAEFLNFLKYRIKESEKSSTLEEATL